MKDLQIIERFEVIVAQLVNEPDVAYPRAVEGQRRVFGSNALTVAGKIFAMVDSLSRFVVKLPADRVKQLMDDGRGARFEIGKARWMKEWVVLVAGTEEDWPQYAREALDFVRGLKRK